MWVSVGAEVRTGTFSFPSLSSSSASLSLGIVHPSTSSASSLLAELRLFSELTSPTGVWGVVRVRGKAEAETETETEVETKVAAGASDTPKMLAIAVSLSPKAPSALGLFSAAMGFLARSLATLKHID